jgi:hypothetical protein
VRAELAQRGIAAAVAANAATPLESSAQEDAAQPHGQAGPGFVCGRASCVSEPTRLRVGDGQGGRPSGSRCHTRQLHTRVLTRPAS